MLSVIDTFDGDIRSKVLRIGFSGANFIHQSILALAKSTFVFCRGSEVAHAVSIAGTHDDEEW
jgi:hypothetical protein